jgi:hypothetical protein
MAPFANGFLCRAVKRWIAGRRGDFNYTDCAIGKHFDGERDSTLPAAPPGDQRVVRFGLVDELREWRTCCLSPCKPSLAVDV